MVPHRPAMPCGRPACPAVVRMLWPLPDVLQITGIAALCGVSASQIWYRAAQLGVEDQRPRRRKPRYTERQFRALWLDDRLSLAQIGARLGGLHPVNVGQHGRRLGLPPRKTGTKARAVIGPEFDLMWRLGVRTREIAGHYGIGQPAVTRVAKGRGLDLRIPPVPQGRLTLAQFREWQLGQAMAREAAASAAVLKKAARVDSHAAAIGRAA